MATAQCSFAPSLIFTLSEASAAQCTWAFHLVLAASSADATGLVPVMTVSKAGGAFAAPNAGTAITELTNGWYKVVHNPADLDTLGCLAVRIAVATADTINVAHQVTALDLNVAGVTIPDGGLTAAKFSSDALAAISTPLATTTRRATFAANGNDAVSMRGATDVTIDVTGTFGGGTIQAQVTEDPTVGSPAWTNSGAALSAAGRVVISGPHNAVRTVCAGATTPALAVTYTIRKPAVVA